MRVSLQNLFLFSTWLMLYGCGAWLGNPKDFGESGEPKKNQQVNSQVEIYAGLELHDSGSLKTLNKSGTQGASLQLNSAQLKIESIQIRAGVNESEVAIGQDLVFNNQGSRSLGTQSDLISQFDQMTVRLQDKSALVLKATYEGRPVSVSLDADRIRVEGKDTTNLSNGNRLFFLIDGSLLFDFTGETHDLSDLNGQSLDLDANLSAAAQAVKQAIIGNFKRSGSYGLDADKDGILSSTEKIALPSTKAEASDDEEDDDSEDESTESPETEDEPDESTDD